MYTNRKKISLVYVSRHEIYFKNNHFMHTVIAVYFIAFTILSIKPIDRVYWWIESIIPAIIIILLSVLYTKTRLTNSSYLYVCILLILHAIGSHYTYSLCPVGFWLKDILKCERNNYDRLICFLFGVLIYIPVMDILYNRLRMRYFYACVISCLIILSFSAINEIIQIYLSMLLSEQEAAIYLGFQSDVFDCQKDMATVFVGSFVAMIGYIFYRINKNRKIHIVKTYSN